MIHLPLLRADGLGYDFPGVTYNNSFETIDEGEALVINTLSGPDASIFTKAVLDNAAWVSEIRSPHTLYSEYATYHLNNDKTVKYQVNGEEGTADEMRTWEYYVKWNPHSMSRPFLITQLCSHQQTILPKKILSSVWQDGASEIAIQAGRVLARGKVFAIEDATTSILKFVVDKNMKRDGEIRIAGPDHQHHFKVFMTQRTLQGAKIEKRDRRSGIMTAALVGSLARLNNSHDPTESQVLWEMSTQLHEKGVATWMEEDYDPAQAATCLEPYQFPEEWTEE